MISAARLAAQVRYLQNKETAHLGAEFSDIRRSAAIIEFYR